MAIQKAKYKIYRSTCTYCRMRMWFSCGHCKTTGNKNRKHLKIMEIKVTVQLEIKGELHFYNP